MLCKFFIASGKIFPMISKCNHITAVEPHLECYPNKVHYHHKQQCLGAGYQTCHQKWGSNFAPNPNMANPKIQHHQPFFLPPKVSGKLTALHIILPLPFTHLQIISPLFLIFKIHIRPCGIKPNTFKICIWKSVNITYTTIYLNHIFGLRYKNQFIELMIIYTVWILIPYWFTWVHESLNTAHNKPLLKTKWPFHDVNFVMSNMQYVIVLRETYKLQTRKYYCCHSVN